MKMKDKIEKTKSTICELDNKKQLEAAVTDLNGTDMFLGHDWLVKHNPEINWKNRTIKFMRCPESCKMKHQDIKFKTKKT